MTHTKKLNVLIIEDRALISDLLSLSLEETGDFETTSVSTVKRAFEVKADKKFDLVMLETSLANPVKIRDVQDMVQQFDPAKVVLFGRSTIPMFAQNCLDIGVSGLIPKQFSLEALILTLKLIHTGQKFIPSEQQMATVSDQAMDRCSLSRKEFDVLKKLTEGLSNKDIMVILGLSESTVKMHIRSICKKLGATNRTQALVFAQRHGLI
ncbi:helix-turn-helix transcriptional regulator [Marivita sp.]|uniref:helix-turn-helix transcriptional regulator n=1 Tax=Marivita sp. TaxID=2003365 RepID=UPI00260BB23C|nr:response regulator transcription factor [Marivita sp.]